MAVNRIYYKEGKKYCVPVTSRKEYYQLRDSKYNFECVEKARKGETFKDKEGKEVLVPGKTVICALGQRANRTDVDALRGCAPFVLEVGDCVRPANITKAIYEAYHAALDISVSLLYIKVGKAWLTLML